MLDDATLMHLQAAAAACVAGAELPPFGAAGAVAIAAGVGALVKQGRLLPRLLTQVVQRPEHLHQALTIL